MATTSSMFMYSLTLQASSDISAAVLGQFAGTKEQQIITASGSKLTIHRPDATQGRLIPIFTQDCFAIVRRLAAFRLAGGTKDYLIVSSDSGRITILEWLKEQSRFSKVHLETYGKSGIRRVIPGEFLAVDPKGRACLIASIEKNKIVYVLNRNAQAALTISSPLEAHKPGTLVFDLCALDVGYENPAFAAIEVDVTESDQDPSGQAFQEIEKNLVYYELDLGLNHVVRKWAETVDRTATKLFPVPGGADGPSGVLVCGVDNITYRHSNQDAHRVPIPRRRGILEDPERKRTITAGIMHKIKNQFFLLLQTSDGDLFKVTIDMVENDEGETTEEVKALKIKYFDTVPAANNLLILKSGFLFVAATNGNHHFYQFEKLGDDDDETEISSENYTADPTEKYDPAYFHARPLSNLALVQNIESMNHLTDSKVVNLLEEDGAPQIYALCAAGARSSFKTLKHGLSVSELVESELPDRPNAVWTTKLARDDEYDAYIVLSFNAGTLVLSIGETVEEVTDTGFLSTATTLAVQQLGEDALVQVYPKGIRHIRADKKINEWPAPEHRSIVAAATNERQIAIALSSGDIVYFELDNTGTLQESVETREMTGTVTALALGEVPEGRVRSDFLAVGCDDSTVRILSLDPLSTLESKSVQALTSAPSSLSIMSMSDNISGGTTLYLHIGLYSGVYLRTVLDEITGELSDVRTRFLGLKPTRLFQVTVAGQNCILATSSRAWLGYSNPQTNGFMLTPLDYPELRWAWTFSSEQCPQGIVGIQEQNLRIFSIEDLNRNILQETIPLSHTPRRLIKHPQYPLFCVYSSDYNTLANATRAKIIAETPAVNGDATVLPPEEFGLPRAQSHWSSSISIIDPVSSKSVIHTLFLENNECITAFTIAPFSSQEDENFLVVGTAKDLVPSPRSYSAAYLHIYRFHDSGRELEFIHKTTIPQPSTALLPFQGRLLAGVGPNLLIYDLGMRQLLRKAQCAAVPNMINNLTTQGNRITVSDSQESVSYIVFKPQDGKLIPFADDTISRWTTSSTMLDYETAVGGDKFGNLWIVRCPQKASEEADEENSGSYLLHEKGYLNGAPSRLQLMTHFYVGDIPTSVQKTNLVTGGRDIIFWSGFQGTLGILVPFSSREDVDFFQSLQIALTSERMPPILGRDHLAYRSYYAPSKGVIDGDLCETFFLLKSEEKERIAAEVDRSVREVERKIGDMRSRVAY